MLAMLGWLLAIVGAIWLVITAIQTGKQGMIPLLMVIAGWLLMVLGGGLSAFSNMSPAAP
ncbi:MAG: hypothetical protein DCC44_10860 [Acidobacteria bacterium]|nr:MAG: hypothetical protein DCC44_10860 [Acidobacteriota bacterium]